MNQATRDNLNCGCGRAARGALRRGFTLLELMVAMAILLLAAGLLIPAVGRLIESSNFASATNTVTATLGNARALAIGSQRHTAVMFEFDVQQQVCRMQVLQARGVGRLRPEVPADSNPANPSSEQREETLLAYVFTPATDTVPIDLPKGTAVCGLSFGIADTNFAGAVTKIDSNTWHWYAGERIGPANGNRAVPWLFPRNDPRNFMDNTLDPWQELTSGSAVAALAVRHANTFCVVFSPEGTTVSSIPTVGGRVRNFYFERLDAPIDPTEPDGLPYDSPERFDPEVTAINGASNNESLMRAASQLAVVDVARMGREVNNRRPWFVRAGDSKAPEAPGLTVKDNEQMLNLSRWVDRNAVILGFNRYTGNVIREANP